MCSLADLICRRGWPIVIAGLLLAIVSLALGGDVAKKMTSGSDDFQDLGSDTIALEHRIERATGASANVNVIALLSTPKGVKSDTTRKLVTGIDREIRREPLVARTESFYTTHDRAFVSRDGRSTYIAVMFSPITDERAHIVAKRIRHDLKRSHPDVKLGGWVLGGAELDDIILKDLQRAELIAFPILFLLSLFVFRGLIAALLPLLVGGLTIVSTWLVLTGFIELDDLSVFALNLVTGLGLGLAIDYSLFIVSRYREELARHGPGPEALRQTMATAGRTVAFSSITVAAALSSLLVFPHRFLHSMGVGGVAVTVLAAVIALVLLPALLALLGARVNALAPKRWQRAVERTARSEQRGGWYRLSRSVMRRPIPVVLASAAVLIAAGIPFLRVEFKPVDEKVLPTSSTVREVRETLNAHFPPNRADLLSVAVGAPRSAVPELRSYASRLSHVAGVTKVTSPRFLGHDTWNVMLFTGISPQSARAGRLVREVRMIRGPDSAKVGGAPAWEEDQSASIERSLPLALLILSVTTLVALFAMTGSVILPLKALVMNLLTLSAAFGLLVLIFQDGRLQGLLDYHGNGGLERTQPVLLFALAFGLSTDYGVFLLSRIKESHDVGASNRDAVATGLQRTGRIVTAAALLFTVAIGVFATSQVIFVKQLGIGTALAVLIDATIVRALLVPALMALLGRWNWWAPRPLRRLHRRLGPRVYH